MNSRIQNFTPCLKYCGPARSNLNQLHHCNFSSNSSKEYNNTICKFAGICKIVRVYFNFMLASGNSVTHLVLRFQVCCTISLEITVAGHKNPRGPNILGKVDRTFLYVRLVFDFLSDVISQKRLSLSLSNSNFNTDMGFSELFLS